MRRASAQVVSPGAAHAIRMRIWRACWRFAFPQEDFKFSGWASRAELAAWLEPRGWRLESDATYADLVARYCRKEDVAGATGSHEPLASSDLQHLIVARRV